MNSFDVAEYEKVNKISVLIVLLKKDETFNDVTIDNISFHSNKTRFIINRKNQKIFCSIMFGTENNLSTIKEVV